MPDVWEEIENICSQPDEEVPGAPDEAADAATPYEDHAAADHVAGDADALLVAGEEGANIVTILIALCVIDVSLLLEFVISDVINVCSRGATLLLPCDVSIQKSQAPAEDDPYFFAPIDDFSAELHAALDISRIEARGNDLTHAVMREALTNHLSESNLEIAHVAADGNCQFLAVARAADSLGLEPRSGEVWRMRVAFELHANREQYEPFHDGDFNSYVQKMAMSGARVKAHQHHCPNTQSETYFILLPQNPTKVPGVITSPCKSCATCSAARSR